MTARRDHWPRRDRSADTYVPHGTGTGYTYWRCSCPPCTEWNRLRARLYAARKRAGFRA